MNHKKQTLIEELPIFTGKLFSLVSFYMEDPNSELIKIFNSFVGNESLIDSNTISAVMDLYEETKDESYLIECSALIYLLYKRHQNNIHKIK